MNRIYKRLERYIPKIKYLHFCFLIILLMLLSTAGMFGATQAVKQDSCKVLFIGNSYFKYNNLPYLFRNISDSLGRPVIIGQNIVGGTNLAFHAENELTEQKIYDRAWDYVVLMPVPTSTAYPEIYNENPVFPSVKALKEKIIDNCDSTKIVLCMPWAFEDGMIWLSGWTDEYPEMQAKIYENTILIADSLNLVIAPVGWAWNSVLQEKNYPLHYLHLSDWSHPSMSGSFLMACVIYSTIFMEDTEDCEYLAVISEAEANYFQTVATRIVLDSPELWNLKENCFDGILSEIPEKIQLFSNFPNPFNSSTKISYILTEPEFVNLSVYDISGRLVEKFIDSDKSIGTHVITWNASQFNSGIYILKMETDNILLFRKVMIVK